MEREAPEIAEKPEICRLHRTAPALLGVTLLGGTPAVYPLLMLLFPTLKLVVMEYRK